MIAVLQGFESSKHIYLLVNLHMGGIVGATQVQYLYGGALCACVCVYVCVCACVGVSTSCMVLNPQ